MKIDHKANIKSAQLKLLDKELYNHTRKMSERRNVAYYFHRSNKEDLVSLQIFCLMNINKYISYYVCNL